MACPRNLGSETFKVIEKGRIRSIIFYDFPSVCTDHSLSCTIFELFNVEECREPEGPLKFIGNEMTQLDRSHTSYYSSFTVTMAVSCIVSEIKRDWSKIAIFSSYRLLHNNLLGKGCEHLRAVFFTTDRSLLVDVR